MFKLLLTTCLLLPAALGQSPTTRLNADVVRRLGETDAPVKVWVFFVDKGLENKAERDAAIEALRRAFGDAVETPRAGSALRLR